ncbi:MAG: L-threonylcarbamoyladenylate synthase, partial [Limnohabitans sp.]
TLQALLALLEAPLLGTTLILPGQTEPLSDPVLIRQALEHEVAGVIDAGPCGLEPTTVVDLSGDAPTVIRQGQGAIERIGMV